MKAISSHQAEWTVLRTSSVNALLVGAQHLTAAAVARLGTRMQQPLVWWAPDHATGIPDLASGTLVVRDVDRLDPSQQETLAHWIGTHKTGTQVLALTRTRLFDQVENGRFSSELYYRITTVMIEMHALTDLP